MAELENILEKIAQALENLSQKDVSKMELSDIFKILEQGYFTEPRVIRIYLNDGVNHQLYSIAGNYLYFLNSSSITANISIKFNRQENDYIKFEKGLGIRRPFLRFWIYAEPQANEWVDLLIGQVSPYLLEIIDNRTALIQQQTLEEIKNQRIATSSTANNETTIGTTASKILDTNTSRKQFSIQAHPTNTGNIYILYGASVSTTKYKAILQAGQFYCDDVYKGVVYAISDTANQKIAVQEET